MPNWRHCAGSSKIDVFISFANIFMFTEHTCGFFHMHLLQSISNENLQWNERNSNAAVLLKVQSYQFLSYRHLWVFFLNFHIEDIAIIFYIIQDQKTYILGNFSDMLSSLFLIRHLYWRPFVQILFMQPWLGQIYIYYKYTNALL